MDPRKALVLPCLLLVAGCGTDSPTEGSACQAVSGAMQVQFTSPTTASGTVSGDLRGSVSVVVRGSSPGANNTTTYELTHTFVTAPGDTLVTNDQSVMTPLSQTTLRFEESLTVARGTGAFRSATGKMTHRGEANSTGAASGQYQGEICGWRR